MSQPMPIVRQMYLPGLIPQFLVISVLCAIAWLLLPTAARGQAIVVGPIVYLIFCRLMRWWLVRDHTQGIRAYCYGQLGDGARAIELFERVLQEVPDHAVARSSLNLLRAAVPPTDAR